MFVPIRISVTALCHQLWEPSAMLIGAGFVAEKGTFWVKSVRCPFPSQLPLLPRICFATSSRSNCLLCLCSGRGSQWVPIIPVVNARRCRHWATVWGPLFYSQVFVDLSHPFFFFLLSYLPCCVLAIFTLFIILVFLLYSTERERGSEEQMDR